MNNQAAQTMPAKFRKKPVVIDALQYTGRNQFEVMSFVDGRVKVDGEGLIIPTLEGQHIASPGDWIIRGVKGEFHPCKPDIFAMTYEPAAALSQTAGVESLDGRVCGYTPGQSKVEIALDVGALPEWLELGWPVRVVNPAAPAASGGEVGRG